MAQLIVTETGRGRNRRTIKHHVENEDGSFGFLESLDPGFTTNDATIDYNLDIRSNTLKQYKHTRGSEDVSNTIGVYYGNYGGLDIFNNYGDSAPNSI